MAGNDSNTIISVTINCGDVWKPYASWYNYGFMSSKVSSITFGNDCTMTKIENGIFRDIKTLSSITIPSYITSIGYYSFYGCLDLVEIIFPTTLTQIDPHAFENCLLLKTLPTEIYNDSTVLIRSLTTIQESAFLNCTNLGYDSSTTDHTTNLINLLRNSYITTIGAYAFAGCHYLVGNIDEDEGLNNASSTETKKVPITYAGTTFNPLYIKNGKTYITVAADGTTMTYASVGTNAFKGATSILKKYLATNTTEEITSIEIQSGVTSIGSSAFEGCTSITSVTFPSTLTTINSNAFFGCTGLTTVVNNSSLITNIGNSAFKNCSSLQNAGNYPGLKTLSASAFSNCGSLTSFNFNEGLEVIGQQAFMSAGLTGNIVFPSTLGEIGTWSFSSLQGITSVDFSNTSLTSIGYSSFYYCRNLTTVSLNNGLQSLNGSSSNSGVFTYCVRLSSIFIPSSVTTLGHGSFAYCSSLTQVTGCAGVTTIDASVFNGCTSLKSVGGCTLVSEIKNNTFCDCSSLTTLNLSWNSLTSIGEAAFKNCSALTGTITLPSITNISVASNAFTGCGLTVTFQSTSGT